MAVRNLWGDLGSLDTVTPPNEILEEQDEVLKQITKGVLELSIDSSQRTQVFCYDIYIALAKNKSSRTQIFRMTHDTMLYPAKMHIADTSEEFMAKDEEDFKEKLATVLQSEDIRRVISLYLAQERISRSNQYV